MNSTRLKITQYWYFALTIFVSAFLLFQIQPMISKFILPWFGGGPAVWTTSQAFFQLLLLGGYAYAHAFSRMRLKTQVMLHAVALALALIFLAVSGILSGTPVMPSAALKPETGVFPFWQVLLVLLASVGLPYFLLSTTSSLIQSWFSRIYRLESPYSFYILSNAASLFALLSYPVLFEPTLTLTQQAWFWSAGFLAYLGILAYTGISVMRCAPPENHEAPQRKSAKFNRKDAPEAVSEPKPNWKNYFMWINLAAVGTVMSLATTNQMTQDFASVPFLWVLPLSLYLLSFIVAFNDRIARQDGLMTLLILAAMGMGLTLLIKPAEFPLWAGVAANSFILFAVCVFCHSQLYARRPSPRYLTSFYLMLSVGGALGGLLVSFLAPVLFKGFWEFPLGLLFCADLLVSMVYENKTSRLFRFRIPVAAVALVLAVFILVFPIETYTSALYVDRNFYGVARVRQLDFNGVQAYALVNGSIIHGIEAVDPAQNSLYSSYYTKTSGVGLAFTQHPLRQAGKPVRVGVIGLGVGTISKLGNEGDLIRFYEIDPKSISVAHDDRYFTYMRDSKATVEIVEGDARLTLERELKTSGPAKFDIFIIDAFSSDSIPTHLLSVEAVKLYLDHLAPDGVLVFHISNKFINLEPVMWRVKDALGLQGVFVGGTAEGPLDFTSSWVMLSRDGSLFKASAFAPVSRELQGRDDIRLWTDNYSNLFQVVR